MANTNLIRKMRALHRCLGYFVAGLMLMYAVTGVLMVYRNTDALKHEVTIEKQLDPALGPDAVGAALKIKNFKVLSENASIINFDNGSYDKMSGKAVYIDKTYYSPLDKMTKFHKITAVKGIHWIGIVAGVALFLLVVTSFFMFAPSSKQFKSGIVYTVIGLIVAVIAVILS